MEAMLRGAMEAHPEDARWPASIALLTRYKSGISDAEVLARRALQAAPQETYAWFALGVYLSTGGSRMPSAEQAERTRAAIGAVERVLAIDPEHPGALEMAAEYYTTAPPSAGGDRVRAADLTDRLMKLEAFRWRGAELRARICMVTKDWDGVDEWFGKGIEWAPDEATRRELRMQQALLYLNFRNDYERAIRLAEPYAEKGAPDADRFSFVIGQAAYRLGDCVLAIEHDTRVVEAGSPPPNTLRELAACQEQTGDLKGAIRTLELFITRFKGHPNEKDAIIDLNRIREAVKQGAPTGSP